jgi:hypothetical protein
MKPFHRTRAKRATASLALLVWLFALVSGVAHACLLDSSEEGLRGAAAVSAHSSHEHAGTARHEDHAGDLDDESDVSKAPCLKACDDGSRSLPPHISGLDLADPGIPNLVMVLWTPDAQGVGMPERLSVTQPPPAGQPVRTLYSRLTL